ncbi:MAG: IclR family transcriptional regulator [Sphingomonadaceae bacterium]
MRDKSTASVEAIERAIRILDAFSVDRPELGVAEVARILGLKRSTVHRALVTLEAGGILRQVSTTQKYTLGPKVLHLAYILQSQLSIGSIAQVPMRLLRDRVNETVALHLLMNGNQRVVVQQVESTHDLRRTYRDIGKALPLYAGSPGKLLLSYLPSEEIEKVIGETGLQPFTPITITDPKRLRQELEEIRRQGYAISVGEHSPGIASVSCPVRDQEGQVVAAINISGPTVRLTEAKLLELLPYLRETTLTVSRQLGYRGASA